MRLSALWIDVIQRPIHRQFAQHDDLRNTQQGISARPLHLIRQIHGHDIGWCQRLASMAQQGFGIELRVDDEHGAGCARGGFDVGSQVEVVIEGAVGGFVEFF